MKEVSSKKQSEKNKNFLNLSKFPLKIFMGLYLSRVAAFGKEKAKKCWWSQL